MASDKKADPYLIDEENSPLTQAEIASLRPGHKVLREMEMEPPQAQAQKSDEGALVRLDADIADALHALGPDWQNRTNEILRRWLRKKEKA